MIQLLLEQPITAGWLVMCAIGAAGCAISWIARGIRG